MSGILPLDQFKELEREEQIRLINQWKEDYSVGEITSAWKLNNAATYYTILKKLNIYNDTVRTSNKFMGYTNYRSQSRSLERPSEPSDFRRLPESVQAENRPAVSAPALSISDNFRYNVNGTYPAEEVAQILERLSLFLKIRSHVPVNVELNIRFGDSDAVTSELQSGEPHS
ncbi:hypothetical protein ACFVVQ_22130 [Paenibacillus chitinolyticus]|uniref:hypothetical protein n=1 Tax=Paenibacillus TaxID=44249 RepID=UPI00020D7CAB|nr:MULTISPECIES: hypothetical protein [Paenibacillus]EGL14805.1 hypothetical protein HMPREF9413_0749 [Paenibacillus sp. HGF7]EPD82340.1 hypothetical protein HMPREF1207_04167 [Paenibacillus sp. HGH0039]MBV6714276.1 hypothetical protein [Paenibacillus chitinolyticus]MEC0246589.1 hypothetical protein [Paenibacillus chitinolyticus]GKS09113.1 hypothetical protein YDYSY3_01130 [Paenibacillus chitinolyticus]